jgi:OOP family OmpA-OmpF porin
MKRISKTAGLMGLLGIAVMSGASAATDDAFWYIGGNVGQSRAKIDDARISAQLLATGRTPISIVNDERNTAFKLLGGYQFNKNFAVEAGYFNLGQFGYTATTVPAGTLTGKIKLQGLNLDLVGLWPMTEKFSVLGRVGMNYAQAKDNFTSTGAVATPTTPNPSKNALNYKAGLGLQYDFTHALGMRVEAERYRIDDAVGRKGDINMYSLGLVYRFDERKPAPVEKVVSPEPVVVVVTTPAPPPQTVFVMVPPPPPKKVVFSADAGADALFGFGKSEVQPTGKRALDKFATELKGAKYEVITITGHTDRIGSNAANMRLSTRRAEAVRNYLITSAGIPADKVTAKGMGGSQHMTKPNECKGNKATHKLVTCLAPDRRVEVEVVATRTSK